MIAYQKINLQTKADLRKVPKQFLGRLPEWYLGKTVLSFQTQRNTLTLNKAVKKVLKKAKLAPESILLLTYSLSKEAAEYLQALSIPYLVLDDFQWTEEAWADIQE